MQTKRFQYQSLSHGETRIAPPQYTTRRACGSSGAFVFSVAVSSDILLRLE